MISKNNKARILNVLGTPYIRPICICLSSVGIFNQKGEPYSTYSISGVISGYQNSRQLEIAIMGLVDMVEELSKPKE